MQSLTVPATLDSLARISAFVVDATRHAGLDEHAAWQVELAVDEAATNIIQHGYGPDTPGDIELTWRIDDDQLIFTLRDRGRRFDPDNVPPPDIESPLEERQPGGLGLFLMSKLMDSVRFDFDDQQGNLLTMSKRLPPRAEPVQVLSLSGRLDAIHTNEAIARVLEAVRSGARDVVLDMSDVTFLSSSGLRALLLLRRDILAQNGHLRLCALQPQVEEVFNLTGFNQVFAIDRTRAEALAALQQEQA